MKVFNYAVIVAGIALTVGGIVSTPGVEAAPGDCGLWRLDGGVLSFTTSDGSRVTINWNSDSQQPTSGQMSSAGATWTDTYIVGKVEGTTVSFTVAWKEQAGDFSGNRLPSNVYSDDFRGTINPDGQATGTRRDSAGTSTAWTSDQRFTCGIDVGAHAEVGPIPDKPTRATGKPKAPDVPVAEPAPPQPVTDAITLSFGPPKLGSITATISNSSNLPGQCTYDVTPDFGAHRDFTVPPKGSTPLKINGVNLGATYHAVVVCTDSSGTQTEPIGRAEADVTF